MDQFSFEFDAPAPEMPALAPPEAREHSPLTLEDMAHRLEQDANYRVLRRLVPIWDFGPRPMREPAVAAQRVLVLDTETTGLSHRVDKIIELAMLLVDVDPVSGLPVGPVDVFEGFEDPGMPIPAVAQEVTGIHDDMVRGHRLDDEQVRSFLDRADVVVAHNAGFDRPFMEARFPVCADKAWACSFADIDWKAAGAESARLGALALAHGWFYDAHRAQVDCHALLQVLARPLGQAPVTGLARLLAAAATPSYRVRATGSPFESKDLLKARGYRWDAEAKVWFCTLADEASLENELDWLKSDVYGPRHARVDIEQLDSRVRYSARAGSLLQRTL